MTTVAPAETLSIVTNRHSFFESVRAEPEVADGLRLQFIDDFKPVNRAFRPMVQDLAFDFSELALATYVQARAKGVGLTLLPLTVMCRFQHRLLVHDRCRRPLAPKDLEGLRVGVRAYSQTTGVWVRSLFRTQYGVDTRQVEWVVHEEAHVPGFGEPENVTMSGSTAGPLEQLRRGEIDALIAEVAEDDCVRPVITDPERAAQEWFGVVGYVPVNHILTVRESLVERRGSDVRRVYSVLRNSLMQWKRSRQAEVAADTAADLYPIGFSSLAPILQAMAEEAVVQALVPDRLTLDELVHPFSQGLT